MTSCVSVQRCDAVTITAFALGSTIRSLQKKTTEMSATFYVTLNSKTLQAKKMLTSILL